VLLHSEDLHTEMVLRREMILQNGCFYTQVLLHGDASHAEMLLHTGALGNTYFYTELSKEKLLDAGAFTHRHLYTEMLYTGVLNTNTFTRSFCVLFFYAEILLHASAFRQTYFDTQ
jgi:hypothetical protein